MFGRWLAAGPRSTVFVILPLALGALIDIGARVPMVQRVIDPICRLLADPHEAFTYIPSPNLASEADPWNVGIRGRLSGVAGEAVPGVPAAATINITYTNFTVAQQAAYQYAVDIWKSQVTADVAIEIDARMASLGSGILGQAGPTWLVQRNSSWYPIGLANQLANTDLAPGDSDIETTLSTNFGWYYGTDGNVPSGQYDFVSVVLHELGHGLGFLGSMSSDGTFGSWGLNGFPGIPVIYDRFAENGSAVPLLTFASPSTALYAQLTGQGGGVFWNGANAISANSSAKPRLYSPSSFSAGSSFSHLNEATYPALNANSLMTPQLSSREAIHNPGPITLGMFRDIGWTTTAGCSYTVSPTSASFTASGGSGSVSVTTSSSCSWAPASNGSMATITSGSGPFTGSGTVSYTVSANTGRARSTTLVIAGQTVTLSQSSNLPTLSASPASLSYTAINSGGGTLTAATTAQGLTISQSGGAGVSWSVTNVPSWLTITPTAGTGTASIVASVQSWSGLPSTGTVSATVTIAAADAQSDVPLSFSLTLSAPATTAPPFGQVDTPLQNASGVQGAIGVTGWALDDVGVSSVKIYRNCLPVDAGGCQNVSGHNVVFVGDAAFVPGARPDIEAAFSSYPQPYRAGWGYLMLTNMLPNVTGNLGYGGQGPLTVYAFATDMEGNRRLLGRTWSGAGSTSPTNITMANASIAKPFGAIDTPGQGQTVSGMLANFGWVLTPDSNSTADATDILIPTNGSTMSVVIDGAAVGTVTYNQCRGNAGNPVPSGLYCDDDVANIFGNPTPQSPFTVRTANPTLFRNLDSGRSAIGSFDINTTLLANGRHSIAWGVTDSAGRAEGIGSREFIVLNGGSLSAEDAAFTNIGSATDLEARLVSDTDVVGRSGFDFTRSLELVLPDSTGVRHMTLSELGRLELWLGQRVSAGYLVANGYLRPLPPGSWLDTSSGRFTWSPIVGYVGTYNLVFLDGDARILIRVTIRPKNGVTGGLMHGYIDLPTARATVTGSSFRVAGWAMDMGAWQGSGVGAVHVWAHRVDVSAALPVFLGAAELGDARPDVAAAFGVQGGRSGWHLHASDLAPGTYQVIAYFWSTRTGRFEDARTVSIVVR